MFGAPHTSGLLTWAPAVALLGGVALVACGGGGGPGGPFPVTTFAGSAGLSGVADGPGAIARFNRPSGLTVDGSGSVYVGDTFNQTIRKISVAGGVGTVATFAGTAGQSGSRNDTGTAATFNFPQGIVAGVSGNLYVADTFNQTIRAISSTAAVTTLAGTPGRIGVGDQQNPLFSTPRGVTVDGAGNVYVADTGNNLIRKITPQRVVTIFAGTAGVAGATDGPGDTARFNNPAAIAIDGAGNLYVADTFNHAIRKITPDRNVQTLAGAAGQSGSQDGTRGTARFNYPAGIAVDGSGNVYVADTSNHTIRKITPAGAVSTIAGKAGVSGIDDDPRGNGSAARFNFPAGLALDRSGNLYVADALNFTIRQITIPIAMVSDYPDGGPVAQACEPTRTLSTSVAGYNSDVYSWYDANCRPRSAALVRNDARDPGGSTGGYLRAFTYDADGQTRECVGQADAGWNGWGYVVNHTGSASSATSHDVAGTYRTVLSGTYHAIHEFKVRVSPGGPVDTTIHWFFATGKSNPVYAITQDASAAGRDRVYADARSPYGNLNFDGMSTANVAGIGWGDRYRFVTTGSGPLTVNSPWDYRQTNVVPYVLMWSVAADAEMGTVQTQNYQAHDSGGDYDGILQACWQQTSATAIDCPRQPGGILPVYVIWPFELNQYGPPAITLSKRLGWGMSYGAVGQSLYYTFGRRQLVGYPYQSYSVSLVLGKRSDHPTDAQIAQVEAVSGARLTATVGTVATSGPGGVGRTDLVTYAPPGFDPVYAVWVVAAATGPSAGRATFQLNPGGRTLTNPVFRIEGWTSSIGAPSEVTLSGEELVPGVDYFATVDPTRPALWLTLNRSVSSPQEIAIRP